MWPVLVSLQLGLFHGFPLHWGLRHDRLYFASSVFFDVMCFLFICLSEVDLFSAGYVRIGGAGIYVFPLLPCMLLRVFIALVIM